MDNVWKDAWSDRKIKDIKVYTPLINLSDKAWKQFNNTDMYRIEKAFLEWAHEKIKDKEWCTHQYYRRYTASMLVEEIFNRKYDRQIDGKFGWIYNKIFSYYSSKVGRYYFNPMTKDKRNKTAFNISVSRIKKRQPYNLKLRSEYYKKNNIEITEYNMKLYPDLKIGHARTSKQEKRIRERRERTLRAHSAQRKERERKYR